MSTSLGEVFVEISGDADPLSADVTAALSEVSDTISSELSGAFDGITDDLGADFAAAGQDAGSELVGALEDEVSDVDLDLDLDDAFAGLGEAAQEAGQDVSTAMDDAAESAESSLGNAVDGLADRFGNLQSALGVAAGAAGLEGFARSQQDSTVAMGRLSDRLGIQEGEIRGMVGGLTDWTFSSHDAVAGMEMLTQRGVDNLDVIEDLLPAWDNYADATGQDFVAAMDDGLRVMGAFGISAEESGEHMDTLTFMTNEVGVPLDRLARTMSRNQEELDALGIGLDESAGLMAALGAQGLDGRDAVRIFGSALGDAEGDMSVLLDTLGISAEEFDQYVGNVGDAAGITEHQADMANSAATPMQRLQGYAGNLAFRFGGLADAAGLLAAPLGAMAPMMMGLNQASTLLSSGLGGRLVSGLRGAATAFRTLSVAILTNPIFLIAAVVIAIVAAIWYFRDEIMEALGKAWEWIKDVFGNLVEWFQDVWNRVVEVVPEAFRALWDWLRGLPGRLIEAIRGLATRVRDFIARWHPLAILWRLVSENWDTIVAWFRDLPGRIIDAIRGLATRVLDWLREYHPIAIMIRLAMEYGPQILDAIRGIVDRVVDTVRGWVDAVVGFVTDLWDKWVEIVHNIRDAVVEAVVTLAARVVETVSGWVSDVVGFVTDLWNRWTTLVSDIRDAVITIVRALARRVVETVSGWVSDLIGFVTDLHRRFVERVTSIRDDVIAAVVRMALRVIERIRTWISDLIERVTDLRDRFVERVGELVDRAVEFIRNLPSRIRTAVSNFATLLVEAGKDLIRGLISGITDMADSAVSAVTDIGSNIVGGIGSVFRFGSPSKVMADRGRWLMEGLAVGMHDTMGEALDEIETFANEAGKAASGVFALDGAALEVRPGPGMAMTPSQVDPAGVRSSGSRSVEVTQNIYTAEPRRAADESIRKLRNLAYLNAPMGGGDLLG